VARVVVVGSANVDLVWHGPRLPRPGETVTDGTFAEVLGGKGANQAAASAALGADVAFVGCIGDDEHGRRVRADLGERGIDCTHLAVAGAPTGVALITVDERGENAIAVAPGANRSVDIDAPRAAIGAGDVVLCSCEVPIEVVAAAVDHALDCGAFVIVNPAPARATFPGAVLTPNEGECAALGGVDALAAIAPAVIVTLGPAGAALHRTGRPVHRQPAFPVAVVDTTGAGDAFNGAFAWAIADDRGIEDALRLACGAGALATRAIGARASLPTAAELYAFVTD
jgi:ribokinase